MYGPGQASSGHPNGIHVVEVCVYVPAPAPMKLSKHFKACTFQSMSHMCCVGLECVRAWSGVKLTPKWHSTARSSCVSTCSSIHEAWQTLQSMCCFSLECVRAWSGVKWTSKWHSCARSSCVCIPAPASMKLGKHFKACVASAWSVHVPGQASSGHPNGIHVLEVCVYVYLLQHP